MCSHLPAVPPRALCSLPAVPLTGTLFLQSVLQWSRHSARKGSSSTTRTTRHKLTTTSSPPPLLSSSAYSPQYFPSPLPVPSLHLRLPISLSPSPSAHPPSPPVETGRPSSGKYTRPTFYENFLSNPSLIDILLCKYPQ
jgi:hypothetical protein